MRMFFFQSLIWINRQFDNILQVFRILFIILSYLAHSGRLQLVVRTSWRRTAVLLLSSKNLLMVLPMRLIWKLLLASNVWSYALHCHEAPSCCRYGKQSAKCPNYTGLTAFRVNSFIINSVANVGWWRVHWSNNDTFWLLLEERLERPIGYFSGFQM